MVKEHFLSFAVKHKTGRATGETMSTQMTESVERATQAEIMFETSACILFLALFPTNTRRHGVLSKIVGKSTVSK